VNLANEFSRRGLSVHLVLMQRKGELIPVVDPTVTIIDLACSRVRYGVWSLAAYLKRHNPDVLLANMWPLPVVGWLARALCRGRTRVFALEHTTWSCDELFASRPGRTAVTWSMRAVYPRLDGVVAVSNGAAEALGAVAGLPRDKIIAIHNPIVGASAAYSNRQSLPEAWAEGTHDKLLAVGTLKPIKNYPMLLNALVRLRETRDARLLILGEGEERRRLEELVADLGLGDAVAMPGFAADTRPFYAAADLFVLSSAGEGLPTVIVEALEQGIPVVSTDCPSGPREILEDGKYGTLVPVGDVDALARAMDAALNREHDRAALKRRAQDFSVDKAADAYLDLLLPGWRDRSAA
jgi:glycosyltransferase involved in cell wall biosynthesis